MQNFVFNHIVDRNIMVSIELFPFLCQAGLGRFYCVVIGERMKKSSRIKI